jgi:hypothetical protein
MTELRSVAAADRFRVFQDSVRRRDQQQSDLQRIDTQNFDERLRRRELSQAEALRAEQRLQDRRDQLNAEQAVQEQLRAQRRLTDQIANDDAYSRTLDQSREVLNAARDTRDLNVSLDQQQAVADRVNTDAARQLEQRLEDQRQALIDRDARITERRIADRNAAIEQEIQLQRSIERIRRESRSAQSGAERPRGAVLDVTG